MTISGDSPAARADIDQAAAYLLDSVMRRAATVDGQDPAEAGPALARVLLGTMASRTDLAYALAILAVRIRRAGLLDLSGVDVDRVHTGQSPAGGELLDVDVRLIGPLDRCEWLLDALATVAEVERESRPRRAFKQPGAVRMHAHVGRLKS